METASLEQGINLADARMRSGQPEIEDSDGFFEELLRRHEGMPGKDDDDRNQAADEKEEEDAVKEIADLVDKRFLGRKTREENPEAKKPGRKSPGKNQKASPANPLYNQGLGEELHQNYRPIDELFSYLGKFKTATNIYKNLFIEYSEEKEKEPLQKQEKRPDLDHDEFESIIRTKKMNDLMSGGKCGGVTANSNPITGGYFGFEVIGASMQEKWAFLSLFTYNRMLSMLRYSMSLT